MSFLSMLKLMANNIVYIDRVCLVCTVIHLLSLSTFQVSLLYSCSLIQVVIAYTMPLRYKTNQQSESFKNYLANCNFQVNVNPMSDVIEEQQNPYFGESMYHAKASNIPKHKSSVVSRFDTAKTNR